MQPMYLRILSLLTLTLSSLAYGAPISNHESPEASLAPSLASSLHPSTSPTPAKAHGAPANLTALDVLEMQATLLEGMLTTRKSISARAELVTAYERLLGPVCMESMPGTLIYTPNSANARCKSLIEKTLKIDPENPMALCARDGIDSTVCQTAAKTVQLGTYSLDLPYQGASNLEAKIRSSKNAPLVDQLVQRLNNLTFKKPDRRNEAREQEIRGTYAKILALTCLVHRVKLESAPESQLRAVVEASRASNKTQGGLLSNDDLSFLNRLATGGPGINKQTINNPPPTPTIDPSSLFFFRTRLIPTKCEHFASQALNDYPLFPAAICQRYGYYSVNCIDAKRAEKRSAESKKMDARGAQVPQKSDGDIGRF